MSHNGDGGHMMNNEQPQPPGQGTTAFNVKHTSVPACIPSTPILATSTSSPTPFTHANTNNDGHANMPTRGDDAPMIRGMMPTTTTTTMMTNVQQFPVGTTYDEAHMLEEPMPHATSKTLAQHDEDKRDPRSHDHDQDGPSIMRTDTNGRHVYAESSAGPAQCTDAKNDEIEALNANNADSALDGVATNYASGNLPPNGHLSSAKPDSNEPSDSVHQQVTQASESKTLSTSNLLENGNAQVSSNDEGGRNGSTSQLAPGVDEEDELEEGEALSDDMASPPRPPVDLSSRGSQQASLRDTSNSDGTAKNVAGGTAKVFKLYIGGLPDKAEFADVKDCFSQFGEIAHIEFKTGYAFIEYTTEEAAKEAIDTYHEGHFLGKMIRVEAVKTATAQKEAIDKGTCFICGEAGHFAKHCPKDPRNAGRLPPRDRGRPIPQRWHPRDRSPVRDRRDFRDRDVDRDRDWDRDRSRQRERDRDRDRDRERDIGRARGRGVDRERGSERDRERDRERLSLLPRDREVDRYVDRGRVGDIDRDRRSDRDLDRLRDADRDRFPPRELDRNHRRRDDRDRREQDREDYGERGPAHTRPIDRDYRSVSAVSRADERLSAHQDASPARGSMRQPAGRGRDGFGQIDRPDTRRDDGMHRSEPPLPQAGYHQGFNNDRLYEPQDRASNRSPGNSERPRHEIYQAIHEVQPAMQVQGPLPPEPYVNSDRGFSGGNARHQDMPWHGEHPAEDYQFRPGIPADPRLQARWKHEQEKQRVEAGPPMGYPGPPGPHNVSGSRADVRMRGEYPGDQAMYSHDRRSDLVDQSPRHSAPWPVLSPSHHQHPGTIADSHDPHLLQQSRGADRAWPADNNYRGGFPGQAASGPPQPAYNDNIGNHSDYRPRWQ